MKPGLSIAVGTNAPSTYAFQFGCHVNLNNAYAGRAATTFASYRCSRCDSLRTSPGNPAATVSGNEGVRHRCALFSGRRSSTSRR